ncbi:hypothetical protein E2P81_ATG03286 [Venturia nashicola]|nr:hypothetical protein E2P81_ATG03286 [Venturia nashicola]
MSTNVQNRLYSLEPTEALNTIVMRQCLLCLSARILEELHVAVRREKGFVTFSSTTIAFYEVFKDLLPSQYREEPLGVCIEKRGGARMDAKSRRSVCIHVDITEGWELCSYAGPSVRGGRSP